MSSVLAESVLPLEADLLALRELGPWLQALLDAGAVGDLHARLELALHEVCVNVVAHAYGGGPGQLVVTGSVTQSQVQVVVTDHGRPFVEDDVVAPVAGVPQITGYGLSIVRQLVDELVYREREGQNTWLLLIRR